MLDIFSYLESKGVQIIRDDGSELACYCPFHNNLDTPAFYVNKKTGLWICFNPSCGKTGSVRDLMEFFGDHGKFVRDYSIDEIDLNLSFIDKENKEDHSWELVLEDIAVNLPEESYKLQYLLDRSFTIETLEHFGVAFSQAKKRIVIPARDERHLVVGFIGRTVDPDVQPKYLYSKGFPRKDILFNLNNAKRYDSCIVVEGSLDAMKIHQSGFPNVVASLGASITKQHIEKLNKYFDKIIIFSDNDTAGFSMRDIIINGLYHKDLKIVEFEDPDIKDPGDMNDEQIASHINNSIDFFTWSFDNVLSY
jgi:DNA primase